MLVSDIFINLEQAETTVFFNTKFICKKWKINVFRITTKWQNDKKREIYYGFQQGHVVKKFKVYENSDFML